MKIYHRWVKLDFTYFKLKICKHCLVCIVLILDMYLSKKNVIFTY